MDTLLVALIVGVFGGALSAFLGWSESEDVFNPRKFINGLIRAALGGLALAVMFPITQGTADLVLLFIATVGIDQSASKATSIIKKKTKKPSA